LTNNLIQSCPDRVTPPLPFSSGEEYLRLLKEAQKESNPNSLIGSRRDTPKLGSPKSPPNSPNNEPMTNEEFRGVFINYYASKVNFKIKKD
jgi:BCL2/adenovirus E1B 19 kDa protein-interacting protein 3